jgi:chemotaxis protein CheC
VELRREAKEEAGLDPKPQQENHLQNLLHRLAIDGVKNSVKGLSEMIGEELTMSDPEVSLVSVYDLPALIGGAETEAIGVYLSAEGGLSGQFLLIFPYIHGLEMVDLLMFEPLGTTQEMGNLEKSALAESGNICGTFFLNKISELTGLTTLPSTPVVMVDMIGAILNIIEASVLGVTEQVIIIRTTIMQSDRQVEANFWFIPNPQTLESFAEQVEKRQ